MSLEEKLQRWRAAENAALDLERRLQLIPKNDPRRRALEEECRRLRHEADRLFAELVNED